MNRTAFLIDGFNLYHSVRDASRDLNGSSTKWLNIYSLCSSYLFKIGKGANISGVYYFSALAKHLESTNPDVTKRHAAYLECLEASGVTIQLSEFKRKEINFFANKENLKLSGTVIRYEEKETDVAVAIKLLELFFVDECDTAVILSGDTDIRPAVETALKLFPKKQVWFAFPYRRKNKDLVKLVGKNKSFRIKKEAYVRHLLPDPYVLPNGKQVYKPDSW